MATVSLLFGAASVMASSQGGFEFRKFVNESHTVTLSCEGKHIPGLAKEGGGRNFFSYIPAIPGATNGPDGAG